MSACDMSMCSVCVDFRSVAPPKKPTKPAIFLFLFAIVSFEEEGGKRVVKEYGPNV